MTTWHWVRHGPTHEKAFVGWRDVPADLSDLDRLARLNAHLPAGAVLVASDLRRASATADALAAGRQRLPDSALIREFDFGAWDGRHFDEVARDHPELSRAYWEAPGDIRPPGGESWNDAATRIRPFVDQINASHPDAHVVAVAHIGVIMTQIQRATGMPAREVIGHRIDNLSVTRLSFDGAWQIGPIAHCP